MAGRCKPGLEGRILARNARLRCRVTLKIEYVSDREGKVFTAAKWAALLVALALLVWELTVKLNEASGQRAHSVWYCNLAVPSWPCPAPAACICIVQPASALCSLLSAAQPSLLFSSAGARLPAEA